MNRYDLRLNCFSPLVMILTFLFELGAALLILWKYKTKRETQLIVALLLCLAIFQLAEYMICIAAFGLSSLDWARFGWIAISFLPPLGVHLGMVIAQKQEKLLLALGYGIAIAFSGYFLTVGHGLSGSVCHGNYVIFEVASPALPIYMAYYYAWLAASVAAAFLYARDIKKKPRRTALRWLGVGYLAFIIPTIAVNALNPETLQAIPSIMCGFAVLLAVVLLFAVTPRVAEMKK